MKLPELPEIEGLELADARSPITSDDLRLRRVVVDHLELWFDCPRAACQSREVACFDERRPFITGRIIPFIHEGYVDEDGEAY